MLKRLLLALCCTAAFGQAHSVTLFWTAPADAPSGITYSAYRAPGACPTTAPTVAGVAPFAKINSAPIDATTFQDLTVAGLQTYCYYVTAVSPTTDTTLESAPSTTAAAAIPPGPPTITTVVIH